jgi:predicted CXXCH cytochrome family protein
MLPFQTAADKYRTTTQLRINMQIRHSRQIQSAFITAFLSAALTCALHGCNQSNQTTTPQTPGTASDSSSQQVTAPPNDHHKFLGSNACSECHPAIAASWQQHPMANSFAIANSLPQGSASTTPVVKGITRSYHIALDNNRLVHRDQMQDASGQVIYSQQFPMDYVVGSGSRAHAWIRQEGQLLFQSPINWYSEDARWDVAPGYKPDDPRRFRRRVTDDCISCHAGRPNLAANPNQHSHAILPHRYANPAFHEVQIGCERCHGPGLDHSEWHRQRISSKSTTAPSLADLSPDPIVNPAKLEPHLRDSVCNQCHLAGSARIVRHRRSEFDFRPGKDFNDFWTVFHAGSEIAEDGTTKAVNHVQQMHESQCFKNSSGKLGCISCHDPHSVPTPALAADFYRQKCLNCHNTQACSENNTTRLAQMDSCTTCHMPARDSKNIAHVTQTDHRVIRRQLPESNPPAAANSIQLQFFGNARETLPHWEQQRATAAALWAALAKKGLAAPPTLGRILNDALQAQPDDGLSLTTLAALEAQHNRIADAQHHYQLALNDPLSSEAALAGLLDLAYRAAQWENARQLAEQLLELDPGHPGCRAVLADCLWNLNRTDDALAAATLSLENDPSQLEVRRWFANNLRKIGRTAEAEQQQQLIERMETAGGSK